MKFEAGDCIIVTATPLDLYISGVYYVIEVEKKNLTLEDYCYHLDRQCYGNEGRTFHRADTYLYAEDIDNSEVVVMKI
jgi:hypothetical protein